MNSEAPTSVTASSSERRTVVSQWAWVAAETL